MVLLNPLSPITSDREAQRLARSQSEYCDNYKKELREKFLELTDCVSGFRHIYLAQR
jgi:hypothetical protein